MKLLSGIAASGGVAIGPAVIVASDLPPIPSTTVADAHKESRRFTAAVAAVSARLDELRAQAESSAGADVAEIFDAHQMFLNDPSLSGAAETMILDERVNAEQAVGHITDGLAAEFEEIGDDYFAQRAVDIRDLGQQLQRELLGLGPSGLSHLTEPSVIVAHDLTPSETVTIPEGMALAFCTEIGSATSHTAILARGLGLPAVVGLGTVEIHAGSILAVDGDTGDVWLDPDQATIDEFGRRAQQRSESREFALARTHEPATTTDGHRVEVAANIGAADEAATAREGGAEGVGLLRTEFLFLDRPEPPDEDEQHAMYRQVLEASAPHPVVIRTLDIGGDKQVPGIEMPSELNPFLGVRGIRLTLANDTLFQAQLRALLRAGAGLSTLRIMFPMIATVSEVLAARAALERAEAALDAEGVERAQDYQVGIMIEVPSAAVLADLLAPHVDFFSIGTNDLAQYTLAADRTNPDVGPLADAFHPAVLRLIDTVIKAAHVDGKWVGMCGELAGDVRAVQILLGLGLDEFSAAIPAVPMIKEAIRASSVQTSRQIAERCLGAATPDEVHRILADE